MGQFRLGRARVGTGRKHYHDCLHGNITAASLLKGIDVVASGAPTDVNFSPNIDGPEGVLPDLLSKLVPTARLPVIISSISTS